MQTQQATPTKRGRRRNSNTYSAANLRFENAVSGESVDNSTDGELEKFIISVLPIRVSLLFALRDEPKSAIEAALAKLERRGDLGRRECPATGGEVVCDRRRGPQVTRGTPKSAEQKAAMAGLFRSMRHG